MLKTGIEKGSMRMRITIQELRKRQYSIAVVSKSAAI
jgi:hypothetical protein